MNKKLLLALSCLLLISCRQDSNAQYKYTIREACYNGVTYLVSPRGFSAKLDIYGRIISCSPDNVRKVN